MAFIEPMHRNKPNITYLLHKVMIYSTGLYLDTEELITKSYNTLIKVSYFKSAKS